MKNEKQPVSDYGKIPPQAIDIEECLLGSLMLQSDQFDSVSAIINEDSFYSETSRVIYRTILSLYRDGKNIDLMVVSRSLKDLGLIEKVGGFIYITQLTEKASFSYNLDHYARIIAEKYAQREMIRVCNELMVKAFSNESDIEDLINDFQRSSVELEHHFDCVDNGSTTREVAKDTLIEICSDVEKARAGKPSGIDTGFYELNRMIGGFKPATFVILASRPGIGKTSIALHFATTAANKGIFVNFFSFEMTKTQLFKILIAGESGLNRTNIRDGKLTDDELTMINKATGRIENMPILWNTRQMNVMQIKSVIRKNIKKDRCKIAIIDYLQLIKPSDSKVTREQQISEISRELKLISLEFEIPIIALSQLNRLAETEVPQARHLRESGALEQDADNIIFPYKEVDGNFNEIGYSLIIAKARNGSTGRFDIWHNEEMTKFGSKADENRFQQPEPYNPNQGIEPNTSFGNDVPF